jgi:hypothetical protein
MLPNLIYSASPNRAAEFDADQSAQAIIQAPSFAIYENQRLASGRPSDKGVVTQ